MDRKPRRLAHRMWLKFAALSVSVMLILAACGGTSSTSTNAGATGAPAASNPTAASSGAGTTGGNATAGTTGGSSNANATASSAGGSTGANATASSAGGSTGANATAATAGGNATAGGKSSVAGQIDTSGIKKGGTLIYGSTADVRTLNPVLVSDTASGLITALVFSGLVYVDPDTLQPKPDLADKWDVSSDNKTYTFSLHDGVKWQDGEPVTADDVKFSYDLYMNPESGTPRSGTLTKHIKSVEVKDPKTVVFTLNDVIAPFMVSDVSYGIVPKHILGSVAPKDIPTSEFTKSKPVGSGPFKFKEQKPGESVTLVANPDYFRGAPALDSFIYKFVKDSSALYQQLKTGDVDYAGIPVQFYSDAQSQTNFKTYTYDTFQFQFFGYNLDPQKGSPIFQDPKVRQALFYGVDREGIVKKIRNGLSTVAQGTEPVLSWAYQPDKITTRYDYDPKKANQLLDDAGWTKGADGIRTKNGQKLSFGMYTYSGDKTIEGYMSVFQQNWKDIGVEMNPQYEEFSAFVTRLTKTFDFQAFMVGFSWGVDPDQQTMWDSKQHGPGFNLFDYNNPQVDALLDQGLKTLDQEKRKQAYVDMQNLVLADAPSLITDFPKAVAGVNSRVGNLIPNAVNTTFNAQQWYVKDGK